MHTTLTSKGQLTLPKRAREALNLRTGQRLAVEVSKDGRLLLTPQAIDPLSICNILPRPKGRAAGMDDIDRGIAEHVAGEHARLTAKRAARGRRKR